MMQGKLAKVGLFNSLRARKSEGIVDSHIFIAMNYINIRQGATKMELKLKESFKTYGKLLIAHVMQLELLFHMNAIFVTLNCVICVKTGAMRNITPLVRDFPLNYLCTEILSLG